MKQYNKITAIGTIRSNFPEAKPADARLMKKEISYIDIKPAFSEGLDKLERAKFIDVIFHFHKSEKYQLKTHTYSGELKGVFATRSPERPSMIGVTTVELLELNDNTLKVTGLDAINQTPVLDIKVADTYLLQQNLEEIAKQRIKTDARKDILALVLANDTETLLTKAAQLHGHFCPGLAMGVMAATYAMNKLKIDDSDGLEDLLAITETNNCVSDGVQFVTGCTFGNNALIFNDIGKTAFTLTRRDGRGIRISTKADSKEYMREASKKFSGNYKKVVGNKDHSNDSTTAYKLTGVEAAFNTIKLDFDKIFKTKWVKVQVPPYAPSHENIICDSCGEPVMASRIVRKNNISLCLPCAGNKYYELTGDGIGKVDIPSR